MKKNPATRLATVIASDAPIKFGTPVHVVACNLGPDLYWLVAANGEIADGAFSNITLRAADLLFEVPREGENRLFAIVVNMPGYLPNSEDRVVASSAQNAAEAMRAEVDRLLDDAVESESMSDEEATSDLASIDSAIADGDLPYRLHHDNGQAWHLPEMNLVVNAIPIAFADLEDEEADYLF